MWLGEGEESSKQRERERERKLMDKDNSVVIAGGRRWVEVEEGIGEIHNDGKD